MNANDPNVALLEVVAERLGDAVSQERLPDLEAILREIAGLSWSRAPTPIQKTTSSSNSLPSSR